MKTQLQTLLTLTALLSTGAHSYRHANGNSFDSRMLEDDSYARYLHNVKMQYGVKIPLTLTCGYLMKLSPDLIEEECSKSMSLDGYGPAREVCPTTCEENDVVVEEEDGDGDLEECKEKTICEERATQMQFKITGRTCDESQNTQSDKFFCSDSTSPISFPAYVTLSAKGDVYFSGMVDQGEIITASNGGDRFAADTDVVVKSSPSGSTFQSFTFHSSCSRNLFIGDSFGSIQLTSFTNNDQGTVTCEVCKDQMGEFLYKVAMVDGGSVAVKRTCDWLSQQQKCEIDEICTSDLSIPGFTHAKDLCPVTCQTCPLQECEKEECLERPTVMKFKVQGGDCSAGDNDQGGKYICEDFNPISFPARVVMTSTKSNDALYYNDVVYSMGEIIEARNGGDRFDADMIVEISSSSPSGKLYQRLQYHSSCSRNLFVGDVFGAVKLVSFTNTDQGTVDVCDEVEPPMRETCPDGCPLLSVPEPPFSLENIEDLERCCSDLIDEEDRPDKDLCCSALEDNPPAYCACQAPYPSLPFTDAEQDVLEECCNSDNPPPESVCCSLDDPPAYCACQAPYPSLPFTDAEQDVLEECCNSDNPPPESVCCSLDEPPAYCACQAPYPSLPFTDAEQEVLEECCNSDNPPPEAVCCSLDEPPAYCACQAPHPSLPFTDAEQEVLEECCNSDNPPPTEVCCSLDELPGYCVPSQSPTQPPTPSPSQVPSDHPSEEPTLAPIEPDEETAPPTPSPTPAPTSCSDLCAERERSDAKFLLKVSKVDGIDIPILKTCRWLDNKPEMKQATICDSYDSFYGFEPARDVCLFTCGRCPCTSEPTDQPSRSPTDQPSSTPTLPPIPTDSETLPPTPGTCEPCDPYTDPECPFECPSDICEVRPENFYFRFSGGTCKESDNSQEDDKFTCTDMGVIDTSRSHYLVFSSGKSDGEVYYEGWVHTGEVVTLSHSGKFQSDMRVDVYAGRMKWKRQTLVYHSSCSQNLFNGDVFGAVTLMGFKSYAQDSKCTPTNCVTPECDPETDPDCVPPCERTICERRPDNFFFRLTGGSCDESNNDQADKFTCHEMGSYNTATGKYIEFTDTSGYETYFNGWVAPNEVVELTPPSGRFPADMLVRIYTAPNKRYMLQDIQYHSSCSRNLFNGDSFGAVTLVGFESDEQDVRCF